VLLLKEGNGKKLMTWAKFRYTQAELAVLKKGMPMDASVGRSDRIAQASCVPPRLVFVDNLRWVMIVLVVSMHAAVTYSHLGSWYFMEDPKPGLAVLAVFATYQVFLQAFFMGLLFLVAGYFVPAALDRKGWRGFIHDRAVRLGIPSLVYMLVIHPFTVYWLLRDFFEPARPSLLREYPSYILSGRFLGSSGPMWFAVALLIFSAMYAFAKRHAVVRNKPDSDLPGNAHVFLLALAIAVCAFAIRIIQPMGTNVLNMQLCFFSQYVILFAVGILARRRNWLVRIPYAFGMRWFVWTAIIGTAAWAALLGTLLHTHTQDKLGGGFTWQSAAFSFWESFFCVGVCLGLLVLFRERFNHQGKLARWLSDNSFAVYMFHTPVLIAVTLAMRGFEAPKLVKFGCATILGVVFTYAASSLLFRRIPLLRRVL